MSYINDYWLKHPKAVVQTFYNIKGRTGAFQCRTHKGNLQIWFRSERRTASPNGLKLIRTLMHDNPEEIRIIELARKDPRYAIASHLRVNINRVTPERSPNFSSLNLDSGARFRAIQQGY